MQQFYSNTAIFLKSLLFSLFLTILNFHVVAPFIGKNILIKNTASSLSHFMQQFYSNVCILRAIIQEASHNTFTAHTYLGCLRVLIEHFWKLGMISLLEISSQARSNHLWHLQNFHIVYFCNSFYHEVLYCFCPPLYYGIFSVQFSSFQSLSRVWLSASPWFAAHQASLSITNSQSLPKLMSIESMMSSSHLIFCHPLLLLPPTPPSIRVFSNESTLRMRWPKYWSFSSSISLSKEHPGLISFRMDWLDLLAVQGTLKSLLQHHSSKASILRRSAFFTAQLSHPNMITGKTIALTRWTFVGKTMSLLFNMLSKLVITFLPRSKHLLISWLQSPSAVILEPPKIKSDTVFLLFPQLFAMRWWDQMPWF